MLDKIPCLHVDMQMGVRTEYRAEESSIDAGPELMVIACCSAPTTKRGHVSGMRR